MAIAEPGQEGISVWDIGREFLARSLKDWYVLDSL